ncbi:MAG: hypothetical protein MJ231_09000 [bacterium]|nr:hypothetical protein [bacterium]
MHIAISNLDLFKVPVFGFANKNKINKFIEKTKNDLLQFTNIIDMFKLDSRLFNEETSEESN